MYGVALMVQSTFDVLGKVFACSTTAPCSQLLDYGLQKCLAVSLTDRGAAGLLERPATCRESSV